MFKFTFSKPNMSKMQNIYLVTFCQNYMTHTKLSDRFSWKLLDFIHRILQSNSKCNRTFILLHYSKSP